MAESDPHAGIVAFNRFGMGGKAGAFDHVAADPRGALKAELATPDIALVDADAAELSSTVPNIQAAFAAGEQRRLVAERQKAELGRAALAGIGSDAVASGDALRMPGPQPEQQTFRAEAAARFSKAASAPIGFVERLVAFWSNHFCVSVAKSNLIRAAAGSFEREAIRPHVLGSFAEMLLAVERHPAMLVYLDNAQSVGPDSPAGQHGKRGLNENLAREIMELHTLGVDGGYAQDDVTALARVLTGWTYAGREGRLGEPGSFVFNARAHEPGDQMVVGKAVLSGGEGQGEAALLDLARNPATATHIATKLARHFIADDPPASAVERLARVFRERDGDLRALAATLIDLPECWSQPMTKLRNPYDLAIAMIRLRGAAGSPPDPVFGQTNALGMPLWEPPGPNGFPDTDAAWASPEGLKVRLFLAQAAGRQMDDGHDPRDRLAAIAGTAASEATRTAIDRAESRQQAFALLLMSPEFQRR